MPRDELPNLMRLEWFEDMVNSIKKDEASKLTQQKLLVMSKAVLRGEKTPGEIGEMKRRGDEEIRARLDGQSVNMAEDDEARAPRAGPPARLTVPARKAAKLTMTRGRIVRVIFTWYSV